MKKRTWIVIGLFLLIILVGVILFFSLRKAKGEKFLEVEIGTNITSSEISLSSSSKTLVPNANIIDKRIEVYANKKSSSVFVRAKIIFESDSDDNRVLSFVSQLNKYVGETKTHSEETYLWAYLEEDNSFYLIKPTNELKPVSSSDMNYLLLDKLIVPSKIEQIGYLNDSGANVQIGEDITIKIVFEAVQSTFIADGKKLNVENVREYFNKTNYVYENGYTALNGLITNYSGTEKCLVLPKYVQNEYILGVDADAFSSATLENLIVPASYIKINNQAFSSCSNLKFVSIKNYIPTILSENAFTYSANLNIYVPNLSFEKYSTLVENYPYKTCVQTLTQIESTSIESADTSVQTLYLPNVRTLEGQNFDSFTNLKYIYAPYLEKVEENQFKNLTNLLDVEVPNAKIVGKSAFQNCSNLLTISISKNLESIGEYSFNSCSSLKNLSFISNLSEIPTSAFRYCTSLGKINLKANGVVIGAEAFANSSVNSVKVSSLSQIQANAFSYCSNLNYVRIDGVKDLNVEQNAFQSSSNAQIVFTTNEVKNSATALTSIFGSKVVVIGVNKGSIISFEGSLNTLNLSNIFDYSEISSIEDNAFEEANIKHLYLNSNITKIGKSAFANSTIINVYLQTYQMPTIYDETFKDVASNFTLKVPNNVLSIFMAQITDINIEGI